MCKTIFNLPNVCFHLTIWKNCNFQWSKALLKSSYFHSSVFNYSGGWDDRAGMYRPRLTDTFYKDVEDVSWGSSNGYVIGQL